MLNDKIVLEMAKLIYFNIDGASVGSWDKLHPEQKDEYLHKVKAIEENFDRLGLSILPTGYEAPDKTRVPLDQTQVEQFVKAFIEQNIKKPPGILNIFPYQQFAYDLTRRFIR